MDVSNPEHRFIAACRGKPVDRTPVWFMRQAGRYLPEYRQIREKHDILTICKTPDLAVEVTLQPLRRFEFDAAIIFADILPPLEAMGLPLRFAKGEGPVFDKTIEGEADVRNLRPVDPHEGLGFVLEAIRIAREEIADRIPLIGFAGAPFTLASYAIEGGASRNYLKTKSLMWREPQTWNLLLTKIADVILDYLRAQVDAGAQAIQLFDSWVGCLSPRDYEQFVLPHSRSILEGLRDKGVPLIHFGTSTGAILDRMKEAGGDVIGVDWRVPIDLAWDRVGSDVAIQGNLDPTALFAPKAELIRMVDEILDLVEGRDGHVFNLGHGILPETPIEAVETVVERVHARTGGP
ncbi:MAG: uroporphyrinogen decarboxylase [Planctomycetota bacterium]|nr:uroporphyrinogen decarboxylase [Planctomycetota bacterium]